MSMNIMLNPNLVLTPTRPRDEQQLKEYIEREIRQYANLAYPKDDWRAMPAQLVRGLQGDQGLIFKRGLMGIASHAYSYHYGLEVSPDQLWYIVLTQVTEAIKQDPAAFTSLFTTSDSKQLILVPQDHETDINLLAIVDRLKALVPADVDLFLPELSTLTDASRVAHAAAFADGMQQYYDYGMFCCGIKQIQLTGTADDWELLLTNTTKLVELFSTVNKRKLCTYLDRVQNVFANITESFTRDDQNVEFWTDIFTQKNVGSGGDLQVNGWLTDLYLEGKRGNLIKGFHNTISTVPYKNVSTNQDFVMLVGAFRVNHLGGAILQPQFDHMTFSDDV